MKIINAQFNDSYIPIMDGVTNTVKNYAHWINKKYGKCVVVTPSFPKYEDHDEYEVIRYKSVGLPMRPPYRYGLPFLDKDLYHKLSKYKFNILHAHSPFSSGKIALKLAKEKNIPLIGTFHSKFYDDFKEVVKLDFIANYGVKRVINFYNKCDYVYTVNESTIETLREYGFKGEVGVIPVGTDLIMKDDPTDYRNFINEKYHLSSDIPVLLFVGQHIWQKNVKLIIESLNELKVAKQLFHMFFIGNGIAREEMMKMVTNFQLNKHVTFVGNIYDRELIKKYYARADLFLFPSVYDTLGQVTKEAAAFKCPSLVLRNTNASEVIHDNYNGYIAEDTPKKYAQKIIFILNNPNKKHVGLNAQKTIVTSYEEVVDHVYQLFCDIARASKQY